MGVACGCGFDRNGTFIVKYCGLQRGCLYLWVWHVGVVLIAITRKGGEVLFPGLDLDSGLDHGLDSGLDS